MPAAAKGQFEDQVVVEGLRVEHSVVGKDGVVQVDAVLGPIYCIQLCFLHALVILVASARANLVSAYRSGCLRAACWLALGQWRERGLRKSCRFRTTYVSWTMVAANLTIELVNQGPRHILHQIVVGVSARGL